MGLFKSKKKFTDAKKEQKKNLQDEEFENLEKCLDGLCEKWNKYIQQNGSSERLKLKSKVLLEKTRSKVSTN